MFVFLSVSNPEKNVGLYYFRDDINLGKVPTVDLNTASKNDEVSAMEGTSSSSAIDLIQRR